MGMHRIDATSCCYCQHQEINPEKMKQHVVYYCPKNFDRVQHRCPVCHEPFDSHDTIKQHITDGHNQFTGLICMFCAKQHRNTRQNKHHEKHCLQDPYRQYRWPRFSMKTELQQGTLERPPCLPLAQLQKNST